MDFVSVIEHKKRGMELTPEEIKAFAAGAADGSVKDYQLSALLMAIRLNGMTDRETRDLTLAMAESGRLTDSKTLCAILLARPYIEGGAT